MEKNSQVFPVHTEVAADIILVAFVDEFTELRWITVQSGTHPFPF